MNLCTKEKKDSFNILYLGALIQLRIRNFKNFKLCKNKVDKSEEASEKKRTIKSE